MDALEILVRDTLTDRAAEAPDDRGLLEAVRTHRRRRWPAAIAAVAVVLLAVGLTAMLARTHHGTRATGDKSIPPSIGVPPPGPPTPSGYAWIAYHGITVLAPAGVPVRTTPCVLPQSYVLALDPSVAYDCVASGYSPEHTRLTVTMSSTHPPQSDSLKYHRIHAFPGAGGVRVMAAQGITITVTAPSHHQVRTILTSALVARDPHGCAAQLGAVSNPSADSLVPGTPTNATRCIYATGRWLQASIPLNRPTELAQQINALPRWARPPPGMLARFYERDLLRFGYSNGVTRTIDVGFTDRSTFSDGRRTVQDVGNRVVELIRRASG